MSVKILTDSTSDISLQEAARRGLDVVPLRVFFGEDSYRDGVDITHEEFYTRLTQSRQLPTTSQPAPEDFLPYFEAVRAQGDSLVCILLASKLSGTVQSALIAKELCGYEDIYVVDSTQAVIGMRILVDLACQLRDQGLSAPAIAAELEQARTRVRLYAMVDTLEYLHKGGRLPAAAAVAGSLLRVKPLVTLRDGELSVVGKGIGVKDGMKNLLKLPGETPAIDPRLPLYYGYTADAAQCARLMEMAAQTNLPASTQCHSVGAVIGTHAGPGAVVLAYLEQS